MQEWSVSSQMTLKWLPNSLKLYAPKTFSRRLVAATDPSGFASLD